MANDIRPVVDDGARRMTYAELAAIRGISQNSVERLVRRRGWPRQVENDGVVRVLVPLTEVKKVKQPKTDDVASADEPAAPAGPPVPPPAAPPHPAHEILATIRETVRERLEAMAAQLAEERRRAQDAIAAERISAALVTSLRAELERRQDWPLWRRLGWALRPR